MNLQRAKDILQSEQVVEVRLNGQSVWIDSIDESSQTVQVHQEDNPNEKSHVQVTQLQEV